MQKRLLLCLILAFVLLTSPAFVRADGTQLGTISGKVVDERGAALPGATVELTSEDKGFGRSMPTDLSGNFKFALLQSGPYLAPLDADLRGLAPALLVVGTLDPLLSDSQLFAAALQKAGVPAELLIYEDGVHAFLQIPTFDMTRDALDKTAAFCRKRLAVPDPR